MTRRKAKSKSVEQPRVRVAVYTRVSTDERLGQEFNSLDAQRQAIEAYVESQRDEGWAALPERYDDGGHSGATTDRPAFQRLLGDIEAGHVDVVAVYKIDRLSRSLLDFTRVIQGFEERGVRFVSVTQQFTTATPEGRMLTNVLASFAQFEREQIAARTRDKMAATRRRGLYTGGPPILGYNVVKKRLVVDETEAELVRNIYTAYQSRGSLSSVAEHLNREGHTTKEYTSKSGRRHGGQLWSKVTVRAALTNAAYAGTVRFEGELHDGQHEAIVERSAWDAVQAMLAERVRRPVRPDSPQTALLAGLARCGRCGAALTPTHTKRGVRRYTYYTCITAQKRGAKACPGSRIACADLEEVVMDQLKRIGRDPELVRRVAEETRRAKLAREPELISELRTLDRDKERIARERENLLKAIANGNGAGIASLTHRLGEVDEQLQALGQRAGQVRADLTALEQDTIDEDDLRQALGAFDPAWEELFPRERRRVLQLLVEEVTYDGQAGDIEIRFRRTGLKTLSGMKKKRRRA